MEQTYSIVFSHHSNKLCIERQFVLQSRGIDSRVISTENGFALIVSSDHEQQALHEMTAYVEENVINAPMPSTNEPRPREFIPALFAYVWILIIISILAGFSVFSIDWYAQGRIDSTQIHKGEWWRVITALSLHANGQHLLSNIGFGLLFLYYLSRYLGYGLAGLGMLLSGLLGNAINVYMQGSTHHSIGASTAVFGVLGLLSAYVWKMRYFSQASWSKRLGPVFGGIALLAFTGTGGENTDIGAHLWGFVAGLILGWFCAQFDDDIPLGETAQQYYGISSVAVIVIAWLIAMTT